MPAVSRNPDVIAAFREAQAAQEQRASSQYNGFSSVFAAVRWALEMGPRLQSAHGMSPRTELVNASTGERARIAVDGGRGGDLDGTLATLRSIEKAIGVAQAEEPVGTAGLLEVARGRTQVEVATEHRIAQQTLSDRIGKAKKVIARELRGSGILQ